jgi:hypothetical protein
MVIGVVSVDAGETVVVKMAMEVDFVDALVKLVIGVDLVDAVVEAAVVETAVDDT